MQASLRLSLEIDVCQCLFKNGKVELCLPLDSQRALDNCEADVIAASVLKFEYLTLLSLKDATHKKSKERIDKYLVEIAEATKKPWPEALMPALVPAVKKFLGLEFAATDGPAPILAASKPKDKKEKKEKGEKKGKKKDGDEQPGAGLEEWESLMATAKDGKPEGDRKKD